MDNKQIKHTVKAVADINSVKRRLTRKENRELKRIRYAMERLQTEFHSFLFWMDWDNVETLEYDDGSTVAVKDLKPFQDFNKKWIAWCERWRANKRHNTPVNDNAFHDWAINNTKINDYDRPIDFISTKFSVMHGAL